MVDWEAEQRLLSLASKTHRPLVTSRNSASRGQQEWRTVEQQQQLQIISNKKYIGNVFEQFVTFTDSLDRSQVVLDWDALWSVFSPVAATASIHPSILIHYLMSALTDTALVLLLTRIHNKQRWWRGHLSPVDLSLTKSIVELSSQLPLPLAAAINHTPSSLMSCSSWRTHADLLLPARTFSSFLSFLREDEDVGNFTYPNCLASYRVEPVGGLIVGALGPSNNRDLIA